MAFQHDRLDLKANVIRLLTIQGYDAAGNIVCSLVHAPINESRYYALSYTWGDATEQKTILVNGKPFKVRSNLWSFLDHASQLFKGIPFWIDAICIHQNRQLERNHQVQLMGTIYRSALKVLVWLGFSDKGLSWTLSAMQNQQFDKKSVVDQTCRWAHCSVISSPSDLFEPGLKVTLHRLKSRGIARICELEYWSRTWIVQELLLAQSIDLMYEHNVVSWKKFWSETEQFLEGTYRKDLSGYWEWIVNFEVEAECKNVRRSLAFNHYRNRSVRLDQHGLVDTSKSLSAIIREYSSTKCANKLDRVYGFLSLVRGGTHFPVRYGDKPEELAHRASAFFDTDFHLFECLLTCLQVSKDQLLQYWRTAAGWTAFRYAHHSGQGQAETNLKLEWCQLRQSAICAKCRDEMPLWEGFNQMQHQNSWDTCKIICLQPPGISGVPLSESWHLFTFWHSSKGDAVCVRPTTLSSFNYRLLSREGRSWRMYGN